LLFPAAGSMLRKMSGWKTLASRVAIVTGASSGIGAAIAERFGRERMRVTLAARRADLLERAAERTRAAGGEALVVPTDVRDPAAVDRMAAVTKEAWGRIDVLVANAGVGGKSLLKMSDEALAELVETNLLGVMRCARAVVPVMLERRDGHIITNASVAGRVIAPGSVYAATKAGVLAFTEALRRAYADSGIRVSAVLPGWIDTPIVQGVPPRRMAPPGVVADAVVRLLHRPRPEIVVPGWYRIPIWLDHWVPLLTDLLAPRVVRRVERRAERRAARQAERP